MPLPENPSILVLLVVSDGARWLPDVLKGLRAQKYRPLKVLAVDNASTDESGEILARAFGPTRVVRLERRVGYGRALAAALRVVADRRLDADAFLLLHDDAALAPTAVGAMVETLRTEGAGIVGAKLLDWEDPQILQDIGQTTDRYGRQVPRVERGEIDQGQHDGTHEVLYATSACMLVSREVVETVGLFDLRYVALRDDLDLCWRARIAGFSTLVTSDASARHASAGIREIRAGSPKGRVRYFGDRNMIATLIKNYGLARLAVALPLTIGISILNVVLYLLRGRRRAALQVLEALQWNVVHLPSTVRARVRAQRARRSGDETITRLMHHGATRMRAQIEGALEKVVGEVGEGEEERERPPRLGDSLRAHPVAFVTLGVAIIVLLAVRPLLTSGSFAGLDFPPFPDRAGDLFAEFGSGFRGAASGGAAPATPGLVLLGILQFVCFGSGWIAQRVLLLGLPILGGILAARLARASGAEPAAARIAGVVYAATPVVVGTYGAARLSDLVLFAVAPALLLAPIRAALDPKVGWRNTAGGVATLAIAAALAPWSLVFAAGAGAVVAAVVVPRRDGAGARAARATATIVGGAFVLLLPWSFELIRDGSPLIAGGADPPARMVDIIGLSAAAVRPVPRVLMYGLPAAAVVGAFAARGERRAPAAVLGALGVAGALLAWGVSRGATAIAPRPGLPLAATAAAVAVLATSAVEGIGPRLQTRTFGLGHLVAGLLGVAVAGQVLFTAGWVASGRHPGVVESGTLAPSFLATESDRSGAFRVAWIGGTAARPAVSLSGPEGKTLRAFLERPGGAGADALRRTIGEIAARATESGGRMLATFGVRYVIVRPDAEAALADAVAGQVDLAFSQRYRGSTIYENEVGLPIAAAIGADGWVAASASGIGSVAVADTAPGAGPGFARKRVALLEGTTGRRTEEIVLAEDYSAGWRARVGSAEVRGQPSFGWATRFATGARRAPVRITWNGQLWHRAALVGEVLLILGFAALWSRRAARERGER